MTTSGKVRAAALAAAAALLLTGCQFNGLYDVPLPGGAAQGDHVYHVTVEFEDVLDLVPQSAVKVNDVTVGAVEKVTLDGWHARVRLRLDGAVQLPSNAEAQIRQTSLLGEKYVALLPPAAGTPEGRLGDGDVIPLSRTGRDPEVEEVLSALSALLNGGGVAQLHTISVELNDALSGRESRVRDLVTRLDTFVGALDEQRAQIVRALDGIDRLSRTLNAQQTAIAQAVDTMPGALKVLADERGKLTGMLTALSDLGRVGTHVVQASSANTVADLRQLEPVLTRLNQAGTDLPNALELLTTYPFPRNVVDAVKGDYVNLDATADLDFSALYHNLTASPTPGGGPTTPTPGLPVPTPSLPVPLPSLPVPSLPPVPVPSAVPSALPSALPTSTCLLVCGVDYATGRTNSGTQPDAVGDGVDPALADLMTRGLFP
jgi:phospholipid/cholesterol/gamma-HCH transport system substrate-binding protein